MIEFDPAIEDLPLLRKAIRWAKRNKYYIASLSALAPRRTLKELTVLARSWQKAELGTLIEVSEDGIRSVHFSLDAKALSAVGAADEQSFVGRLRSISRSDWIAFGSLLTSAGALAVSILAYLKA